MSIDIYSKIEYTPIWEAQFRRCRGKKEKLRDLPAFAGGRAARPAPRGKAILPAKGRMRFLGQPFLPAEGRSHEQSAKTVPVDRYHSGGVPDGSDVSFGGAAFAGGDKAVSPAGAIFRAGRGRRFRASAAAGQAAYKKGSPESRASFLQLIYPICGHPERFSGKKRPRGHLRGRFSLSKKSLF